jgi:hypothetical protein
MAPRAFRIAAGTRAIGMRAVGTGAVGFALAAVLLGGLAAPGARAQGTMMQAPAPQALPQSREPDTVLPAAPARQFDPAVEFISSERWIIPDYFRKVRERQRRAARYKTYPRALPDGLSAAPARGDILPTAIIAQMDPLPRTLLRELPAARPDTRRYVAGRDVLLVQASSGKVLDILPNVVH